MKEGHSYLPEDIETLLQEKAFVDLYPEEKAFVLKHVQSAEEYKRLRALHQHLNANVTDLFDDPGMPDDRVRQNLLAAMQEERLKKQALWLNHLLSLFRLNSDPASPAKAGAFVFLLLVGVFIYYRTNDKPKLRGEGVVVTTDTTKGKIPAPVSSDTPMAKEELAKQVLPTETQKQDHRKPVPKLIAADTTRELLAQHINSSKDSLPVVTLSNDVIATVNGTTTNVVPTIIDSQAVLTTSASAPLLFSSESATSMQYTWTNSSNATYAVVGPTVSIGPVKSRALSADAGFMDLMYSVK